MNEDTNDDGKTDITFHRVSLPDLYCEACKVEGHTYALIVRPGTCDEMEHRRFDAVGYIDHKVAFTILTDVGKNKAYKIGQHALTALIGRVGKKIRWRQRRSEKAQQLAQKLAIVRGGVGNPLLGRSGMNDEAEE